MKRIIWFLKNGKISPRFIDPFEILFLIGEVAYELALPLSLLIVRYVFRVLMLKRYH